jgi:hypothetical protein
MRNRVVGCVRKQKKEKKDQVARMESHRGKSDFCCFGDVVEVAVGSGVEQRN